MSSSDRDRRTVLVSGILPCRNFSGGLFLSQIVAMAGPPAGIVVLQNDELIVDVDESVARIPTRSLSRPKDGYDTWELPQAVRASELHVAEAFVPIAVEEILQFARELDATDLWIVLEGQALIRVARRLLDHPDGLPIRVQVMDVPGWWLRAHGMDDTTSDEILRMFDETVRRARSCAAASWAMAEDYAARYGTRTVALVPPIDLSFAQAPASRPAGRGIRIGFAGQVYAPEEFSAMRAAIRQLNDEGRHGPVTCEAFTRSIPHDPDDPTLRIHPWMSQRDLIATLADMDLMYCPYWFSEAMADVARSSFPSKLTTYIASGRPVLFHGRADASPARFLRQSGAAFFCFRPGAHAISDCILRAIGHPDEYARTALSARALLDTHLDDRALNRAFRDFMA